MAPDLPSVSEAIADATALTILARRAVEGTLTGLHRSGLHGSSMEFAEHKPYAPGDDPKKIDWKAFGRADRYYLKRFEDETNLRAYFVLDASASMNFGTAGHTKYAYAAVLTAVLAYLLLQQHDLVGLLKFGPASPTYLPPRGRIGYFEALREALLGAPPGGTEKLPAALAYLRERIHRRSAVFVLSDFLSPIEEVTAMSRVLHVKEHELFWLQVLDPAEVEFPYKEWSRFRGLEGEPEVETRGIEAAGAYRREVGAWTRSLREAALEHAVRYRLVRTDEPPQAVLASVAA